MLVVRELLLGPKRFADLRVGIHRISGNLLAQRLRELENAGVLRRRTMPPPVGAQVYELTEWGRQLEPLLVHLGRWGSRSPVLPIGAPMSVDSQVLALKSLFDPDAAGDLALDAELQLGADVFHIHVHEGRMGLSRGAPNQPSAVIRTSREVWAALIFDRLPLADALHAGAVHLDGDQHIVERLIGCVGPPATACQGSP